MDSVHPLRVIAEKMLLLYTYITCNTDHLFETSDLAQEKRKLYVQLYN
jgi:hypothetical protein